MKFINTNITRNVMFVGFLLIGGCSDSGSDNPTSSNNQPVLRAVWQGSEGIGQFMAQRCTPCHTTQSQSGFNVTTHANVMANGDILAGNANDSYLIKKLTGDPNAGDRMPRGGPYLAATEIDSIKAWINTGAQNN